VKVVIFDFDGTIANTFPYVQRIINKLAPKYGFKQFSNEEFLKLRQSSMSQLINKYHISPINVARMTWDSHREISEYIPNLKIDDALSSTLNELEKRGYGIVIVSSNTKKNIVAFLKNNNLNVNWPIYTTNALFGKHKKILSLMRKEHFTSSRVVYVGDEIRDIEASKKANIPIITVGWGYNSQESLERAGKKPVLNTDELLKAIENQFEKSS
jgi:phosphoglycolate phosphatase